MTNRDDDLGPIKGFAHRAGDDNPVGRATEYLTNRITADSQRIGRGRALQAAISAIVCSGYQMGIAPNSLATMLEEAARQVGKSYYTMAAFEDDGS